MAGSPLHNYKCVLSASFARFVFVSSTIDLTWNIELGYQGDADRWWRGSASLPESGTQSEIIKRLSASDVRIGGWKGSKDKCMLKVTFDLPQLQKLSVSLKEYSTEHSAGRAMCLLFEGALDSANAQPTATSSRNLQGISVAELKIREREQTIIELRRRISGLEKTLESRPAPEVPPVLRRHVSLIPQGASLANPSKRRRVVKDMRFDGE